MPRSVITQIKARQSGFDLTRVDFIDTLTAPVYGRGGLLFLVFIASRKKRYSPASAQASAIRSQSLCVMKNGTASTTVANASSAALTQGLTLRVSMKSSTYFL